MNYAVLKSGGKQYRVSAGDVILIEKIIGESGSKVTFDDIIMMGEGAQIHVEENELKAASVTGEVIEQTRGPKLLIFKKKRRHNYRRKQGHKQNITNLKILSINTSQGKTKTADTEEKKTAAKKAAPKKAAPKKIATKSKKTEDKPKKSDKKAKSEPKKTNKGSKE